MHYLCIIVNSLTLINYYQANPIFKNPQRYPELADPLLQGDYPVRGLHQAVAVAAMCLNEEPSIRPLISDVVTALSFLGNSPDTIGTTTPTSSSSSPPSDQNASGTNGRSQDEERLLQERQRAVQEAIEWGSTSRHNKTKSRFGSASSL